MSSDSKVTEGHFLWLGLVHMSKNCSYLVQNSDLPLILYDFLFKFVILHSKKWDNFQKCVKNAGQLSKMCQKCGTALKNVSKMQDSFKKCVKNAGQLSKMVQNYAPSNI